MVGPRAERAVNDSSCASSVSTARSDVHGRDKLQQPSDSRLRGVRGVRRMTDG